jgi:hypothetical protein
MRRLGLAAAALALAFALACAGPRGAGGAGGATSRGAPAPVAALLANDAPRAEAATRAALARAARKPGDPWAHLAAALLARRGLDEAAEARHLLAVVAAAPGDPLALVALRRLTDLAEGAPPRAREIEAGLAPLQPRLAGLAAYRARVARITAAEGVGDHVAAAALRAENGAVSAWTLSGPFFTLRAMDFDRPTPPEAGEVPASVAAPPGLPPRASRTLPAPDGTVALDGEPLDGDVFTLSADVTLARGGRYVVTLGTAMSARLLVDGAPLLERRTWASHAPTLLHATAELGPGRHRVVAKVARSGHRTGLHVSLARVDGAAADVTSAPATGATPPAAVPPRATPLLGAAALAAALEPGAGPVLARLLAARDAARGDREAAKALLAQAIASAPASALVRIARAEVAQDDPTLDPRAAHARAEADLREALARDGGSGEAAVALAALLARSDRVDAAAEALAALPAPVARTPAALELAARVADQRGLAERAGALAADALSAGGGCGALQLAAALAGRREAVAREDELVRALASCRDGRERLAAHLQRRGDPRAAAEALAPLVAARPWSVEPALARAAALVAAGDLAAAAEAVTALRALWPRSPRLLARLADLRELQGDPAAARALREEALLHDGADLALRRALALDDGREVLQDLAEDGAAAIRAYEAARRTDDTSSTMVLDAGAIELHPGGTATERIHQIVHVLDPRGVEQFGEVQIPPGADVLVLRTRKPDGRTLEPERTGASKGSVSLAGLEPGDYLEYEYLRAERGMGGLLAADPFFFQVAGTRLFRSSYAVAAPEGLGLAVEARHMDRPEIAREVVREGGRERAREVLRAVRRDVPAAIPEPNGPSMTELLPHVQAGTGGGLEQLHRLLSEAAADATRPTEELRAFAAGIRAEAGAGASPAALARAAHARVARAILGAGGGTAEEASAVLSRGRGSRVTVLAAVLRELGLRTHVALARPFSADPAAARFPSPGAYAAPLLRVEAGGETYWLDPSSRLAPFGALPTAVLDAEALVLAAPGEPLEVTRTPARSLVPEAREVTVRLALEAGGGAQVEGADTYRGAMGGAAKAAIEPLDASQRRQAVEALVARSLPGVSVTEVAFEGEGDPEAPLVIRWSGRASDLVRTSGERLLLDAAIFPARLSARYVQIAARRTPLLVPGDERTAQRIEVIAPEGYRPRAAAPTSLVTPLGVFERRERVEGRTLIREERAEVLRGRLSPGSVRELATFAATVDEAQGRPLVLERDPG